MKKTVFFIVGSLAFTPALGFAQAQTSKEPTRQIETPASSRTQPQSASTQEKRSMGGLRMAEAAALGVKFVTMEPADFRASRIMGANVYNNQQEEVGEIVDWTFKDGKTISAVVVSVGGFLGLGESYVGLDPSSVVLSRQDGDEWAAYVDTSKDDLRNAPKVQYDKTDTSR